MLNRKKPKSHPVETATENNPLSGAILETGGRFSGRWVENSCRLQQTSAFDRPGGPGENNQTPESFSPEAVACS